MVTRTQIVEAARSYVGLPYNVNLPSKGLLIAVAERLGLPYRDASALRSKLKQDMLPGDVVVVRINATQAQNAILTAHPNGDLCLVRPHEGLVVEHRLDKKWRDRIIQTFELIRGHQSAREN